MFKLKLAILLCFFSIHNGESASTMPLYKGACRRFQDLIDGNKYGVTFRENLGETKNNLYQIGEVLTHNDLCENEKCWCVNCYNLPADDLCYTNNCLYFINKLYEVDIIGEAIPKRASWSKYEHQHYSMRLYAKSPCNNSRISVYFY